MRLYQFTWPGHLPVLLHYVVSCLALACHQESTNWFVLTVLKGGGLTRLWWFCYDFIDVVAMSWNCLICVHCQWRSCFLSKFLGPYHTSYIINFHKLIHSYIEIHDKIFNGQHSTYEMTDIHKFRFHYCPRSIYLYFPY